MGPDLLARVEQLRAHRVPFVLATVVRVEPPSSARPGDRALVHPDGTVEGFVGGACVTSALRLQSSQLLGAGDSTLLRITPADDPAAAVAGATVAGPASSSGVPAREDAVDAPAGVVTVDNPCLSGGTLELLLEAVRPAVQVHVFGDTPIARALAEVGTAAGYDVRDIADPAAPVPPDAAAVVVASHGHHELAVLRAAADADVPYLALVASPKRGAAVREELGGSVGARVKTPAGLDLGARTPGEIAVSIFAELVSVRAGASAAAPAADTALDPVCGMTVAVLPATPTWRDADRSWWFCGPGCRDAFAADPDRYAPAGSARGDGGSVAGDPQ